MTASICAFPWRAAAIRPNGLTIPCCRYPHINDSDMFIQNGDPRQSQHWVSLRNKMLNGDYIENCESCYTKEKNGANSMRQQSLTKLYPHNAQVVPLQELEIAFSNLCNLACVHCYRDLSTKWYAEDVKAQRATKTSIIKNNFSYDHWDLSQLTNLKLIGGEPLLEQNNCISLLSKLDLSKINLLICTNGTVMPNSQLKQLMESCNYVTISLSLDALYSTNDWYRWPCKFQDILRTIKTYEAWWGMNPRVKLMIHTVINITNVVELPDFVGFLQQDLPKWAIEWDWIRWPYWQMISVLPQEIKTLLADKFQHLHETLPKSWQHNSPYLPTIEYFKEQPLATWSQARHEIASISAERNLNHQQMLTGLQGIFHIE